ncbi:MAG: hypothetical protein AAF488_09330 [Planctomycetota bacterium]
MKSIGLMLLIVGMLLIGYGGLSLAKLLFEAGPPQNTAPAAAAPKSTAPESTALGESTAPEGSAEPTPDSTPAAESTTPDLPGPDPSASPPTTANPNPNPKPGSPADLAEGSSRIIAIGGVGVFLALVGAVLIVVGFTAGRRDPHEQGAS